MLYFSHSCSILGSTPSSQSIAENKIKRNPALERSQIYSRKVAKSEYVPLWLRFTKKDSVLLLQVPLKSLKLYELHSYKCFIDDDILQPFLQWVNEIHDSIKFVGKSHQDQISFLDTCVYRNEQDKLAVRVYRKPTDRNFLLHFKSYHPRQLMNNLPYSQFLHLKRNSTKYGDYQNEEHTLTRQLQTRGYPIGIINTAKTRGNKTNRFSLKEIVCPAANRISCGLEFTHMAEPIERIILKNWHLSDHIPSCKDKLFIDMQKT